MADDRLLAVLGILLVMITVGVLRIGIRTLTERRLLWASVFLLCWLLAGFRSARAAAPSPLLTCAAEHPRR